jgi:hypothetical protein
LDHKSGLADLIWPNGHTQDFYQKGKIYMIRESHPNITFILLSLTEEPFWVEGPINAKIAQFFVYA